MMLAALLLAAAAPAPVPGLQHLERQDCTAECGFEAIVATGRFSTEAARPVLSATGAPVCLINPVVIIARPAGKDRDIAGVLTSVTLSRNGSQQQVPVFLTFDVDVTQRVMAGQLCGADLDRTRLASGWQAADPVHIPEQGSGSPVRETERNPFEGLLAGAITATTPTTVHRASSNGRTPAAAASGYDSFSLRGAATALEQAYAGFRKALPSGSDLSPSQWLFKRDSAATLQLLLRSVPKGARVLLGGTDLGLATETPIAVDRASFDELVLVSGKVRRPVKACKVTPLTSASADALVECNLKGQ